ncbi:hypothetical protein WKI65_44220 [Streptomyces sp. MS1.AVA.3]|uniref:hypothetical protein n=1 Tax=Streptomyces decoyicus TaxID=249567 RepID=UPI0030BC1DC6
MTSENTIFLLETVLEGHGTLSHIRRLASTTDDGRTSAFATDKGRALLNLLKYEAKKRDSAYLRDLLHRYGRMEGCWRARSSWYRERSC